LNYKDALIEQMKPALKKATATIERLQAERDAALAEAERLRAALVAVEDCLTHPYSGDATRIDKALMVTTGALSGGEKDGA